MPSKVRKAPSLLPMHRKVRLLREPHRLHPVDPNALPADKEPLPAHELRERLNLFDDPAPKPGEPAKQ